MKDLSTSFINLMKVLGVLDKLNGYKPFIQTLFGFESDLSLISFPHLNLVIATS